MRWADARLALVALAMAGSVLHAQEQKSALQKVGGALERAAATRAAAKASNRFDETFSKYTKRYFGPGFDWRHFKAQAMAESSLNPEAVSPVGARGLMQLMPSTYQLIQSRLPEFGSIDDPEWNIAAGILHDRSLWRVWKDSVPEDERFNFMFASYNAGQGTITRASKTAREKQLDHSRWSNIEVVAPTVPRWRYQETLGYVRRIVDLYGQMKAR